MNMLLRSIAIILVCMQPISGLFCADQSALKAHTRIRMLAQHINPDAKFLQKKESDPANLRGHRWKHQEGISRSEQEYKNNPSQSAQYRTVIPDEKIKQALGIDLSRHSDLLEKIQEEERRHPDKFAFYHGTELDFFVLQDLVQLLYKISHNIHENLDWFPLRTMKDYFSEDVTIRDYLKQNEANINDEQAPYRNHLLSTNLSIPGHLRAGESSLRYFLTSHSNISITKIDEIFAIFIRDFFPSNEIPPIVSKFIILKCKLLIKRLKVASSNGILLQILIDKNIVNETAYLCFGLGMPHTAKFMDAGWDKSLECYTHIKPTLETLQKMPRQLIEAQQIDQLQARILLRERYFAQPNRHVIIKRYHTIPDDVLQSYNKEILSLAYLLFKHFAADRNVSILTAATNAAARGVLDYDYGTRDPAIDLFTKLFEMNYKPAFEAATNAATKRVLDTGYGVRQHATLLLSRLFEINYEPAFKAAIDAATKGILDIDPEIRIPATLLFTKLFETNYEPAFKAATNAAARGNHDTDWRVRCTAGKILFKLVEKGYEPAFEAAANSASKGVNDPDPLIRIPATLLFTKLFKMNYKPAFEAATNAAARGIHDTDWRVRSTTLELFSKLIGANYEPAFETATNAAKTGIGDADINVRISAHELKALIEGQHRQQGTQPQARSTIDYLRQRFTQAVAFIRSHL